MSLVCSLCLLAGPAAAQLSGVNKTFDPSTIYRTSDGTCWVFATGAGIQIKKSSDGGKTWDSTGAVFPIPPAWWSTYTGGGKGAWAPDIIRVGNNVFLYYSLSTLGSSKSCIALAVNSSPDLSGPWIDRGVVIETSGASNYNAIDPSLIQEADNGKLWMSFGSYWSGIKLIQLDPATGKKLKNSPMQSLASRGKIRKRSIEASCLIAHPKGGYVLFVNWGTPPHIKGAEATYEVRMGYSKKPTGPYLDRSGKDMLDGGGAPFFPIDRTLPKGIPQRRIASGHIGLINTDLDGSGPKNWISYFYYSPDDQKVKLGIQRLEFPVGDKFPAPGLPRECCP